MVTAVYTITIIHAYCEDWIIVKILTCDIRLGGSTKQYLEWCKRNLLEEDFVASLEASLLNRAKTRPAKLARRLGSLIGIIVTEYTGHERDYYLDVTISAFSNAEKTLNKKV